MFSRFVDPKPDRRRPAAALLAGLLTIIALTGCSAAGRRPAPKLRLAEIHFTSPGETLSAYLPDAPIIIQTGGITQTPYYDAQGTLLGYINYARVDYFRWLPAAPTAPSTAAPTAAP